MWEHMFVKTHASILKGPRRARSQTYTYFWIIMARLGRHKSNMKSMHARKLWARMQDTLNDALPPWECKVKLIHVTEDMCMSVFYKWSLLIGNALDNMTARTCTLFYWAVCDERRPGAILDRYRNGATGASKGLQERDSKEPGLNHTADAASGTRAVNWWNPCILHPHSFGGWLLRKLYFLQHKHPPMSRKCCK